MADGDIVFGKLNWLYLKPYRWLCEAKASHDECVLVLLKALKEDLKRKGDLPIKLAKDIGESLEKSFNSAAQTGPLDWASENRKIESIVRQADGSHSLKELILRAGKYLIQTMRYGGDTEQKNLSKIILHQYMIEVYDSEFQGRIPLIPVHHAGMDDKTLVNRIEEMQPYIFTAINKWTNKVNTDGSVKNIRMPSHSGSSQEIDMDENLAF